MIAYHDREWGVPVHADRKLFEFLVLEGAQAGLSWETILRKRAGYRAAFERFEAYQPRDRGPVGFTAGPKVAHFDRIEWLTLDPFSAAAALRKGEIDWWENPPRDLVDQVGDDPNITVVPHYATAIGVMSFNHLHPPFDNPAIRRALRGAVDQAEAISAIAGTDRENWRDGVGLFATGTPFANDVGIEVLRSPRDYAAVKQALGHAGYKGEKIVAICPTDVSELGNLTRIGAEQLRRAGMNVDLQEIDFGTVVRRRANQGPPRQGWLERILHPDRPFDPELSSLRASDASRRRQGCFGRVADQRPHRRAARRLARCRRFRRAAADLQRFTEAILGRRAVHPDGRILAGDGVPEGLDRRAARVFCGFLWSSPRLRNTLAAMVMAIPKRSQWGSAQCNSLPDVRCPPNPDHHSPVLTNRKLRRCRRHRA